MPDRDWDKELARIDKQLASLSDDQLVSPPAEIKRSGRDVALPTRPVARSAEPARTTTTLGVYARLTVSLALGVGMFLWPYPSRCGVGLAGYLAAIVVVTASGFWSSIWTWRHRAALAHTLSLLVILWGFVLASIQVLPRVGYAIPSALHPAAWSCQTSAPVAAPAAPKR
jgi:hypothetical protein